MRILIVLSLVISNLTSARAQDERSESPAKIDSKEGRPKSWWESYKSSLSDSLDRTGPSALLRSPLARDELGLSGEQVEKLKEKDEYIKGRTFEMITSGPAGKRPGPEESARINAMIRREDLALTGEILTSEQMERLWELAIQARGPMAIAWPEVQERLTIGAPQVAKIDAILGRYRRDLAQLNAIQGELFAQLSRDDSLKANPTEKFRARFDRHRDQRAALEESAIRVIGRVLTRRQKVAFNRMLGEASDAVAEFQLPGGGDSQKGYTIEGEDSGATEGGSEEPEPNGTPPREPDDNEAESPEGVRLPRLKASASLALSPASIATSHRATDRPQRR